MPVSYQKLWKILKEMGISKTEFRKLVNISTVTLAKLSKDEAVSMAAMESICTALRRPVGEVMEFVAKQQRGEWERIETETVYLVRLFYITKECAGKEEAKFLYGHSIAADEGVRMKTRWELFQRMERDKVRIWEITSNVSGEVLLSLIRCMEQGKSIGEFLDECHVQLHNNIRNQRKEEWQSLFLSLPVFCQNNNYRPEIVLIPERESAALAGGMQPLHAFGESPLISESLVCASKQELYCLEDKTYDTDRMELIYDFFKMEGYLAGGIKDLCRIGDFEVFYPLAGQGRQEELLRIDSWVEESKNRKRHLKGFEITVLSMYLSGTYILEAVTYNAGNPTSYKLYEVTVDGQDVVRTVELPESSTGIKVRLWQKEEEKKIQLVAYESLSLMRDMIIDYHVNERSATLEDKYTKKFARTYGRKGEDKVDRMMERYYSFESRIEDEGNDPWRREFERVLEDFSQLYGRETAEGCFFAQGMEAHEAFLGWLKKQINGKQIGSVWIFDPYIDADSVPRILRALTDSGIKIKIVTDVNAPSHNTEDRIGKIRKTCEKLGELMEGHFSFYAFDNNKCLLHDRMLLLFGNRYLPYVYNMSNSLDNMGMHTPSVVCKLDRNTAKEAAKYYLELFQKEWEEENVQVLWEAEGHKKPAKTGSQEIQQIDWSEEQRDCIAGEENISYEMQIEKYFEEMLEFFNRKLAERNLALLKVEGGRIKLPGFCLKNQGENTKKAVFLETLCGDLPDSWEQLAYLRANITYPQSSEITAYLKENYKAEWGERLKEIVVEDLNKMENNTAEKSEQTGAETEKETLWVYEKKDFGLILKNAGYLLNNPYDSLRERYLQPPGRMALELLMEQDFPQYLEIFQKMEEHAGSWQALKKKRYLVDSLACAMERDKKKAGELAKKCLASGYDVLTALGMQWFIRRREWESVLEVVKDEAHCHEFFKAMLVDLQVEDCRKKYRLTGEQTSDMRDVPEEKAVFLKKLNEVKEAWVCFFAGALTAKQLQKDAYFDEIGMRSKEDVCELAVMLLEAGKLPDAEFETFLLDYLFEKTGRAYSFNKKENCYWREEDFTDGQMILKIMEKYGTLEAGRRVLETLASWERKLVEALHDVFLYKRNYTKWKCYIDTLLWCCAMRAVCRTLWKEYEDWAAEDKNLQVRQGEIRGLVKKYHVILEEYSQAYHLWQRTQQEMAGR